MDLSFIFHLNQQQNTNWLQTFGTISNIIIAILTLVLGYYVFIYQRNQDKLAAKEVENNRKRDISIQWYKNRPDPMLLQ